MKNLFLRFKEWLQSLLRKTEFDNDLFKKGVYRVKKELKAKLKKLSAVSTDELFAHLLDGMFKEFGHIKVVRKFLNQSIDFAHSAFLNVPNELTINKKIDEIGDKIIKFYNDNY